MSTQKPVAWSWRTRSNGISARLAWVVFALVQMVSATLRYRRTDRSGFIDVPTPGPAIYCVWHNRLALCMPAYFSYVRKRNRSAGMAALVSASRDGAFLTGILECFKVQPVRGSSSRRGAQAIAGTDDLGRARLRSGHHAGRSARSALCRAGRRDVAGATDRFHRGAGVVSFGLENPLEKLGSFSNSAAVFPLRSDLRKSHPGAARGDGGRARRIAPAA